MILKERIQEKAEELFIGRGVKCTTMDDIATHLGISKKTIYQFFADKNELVTVIFEKQIQVNQDNCIRSAETAENAVHEVLMSSETFCSNMQSMNRHVLFDIEKYHPEFFRRFVEFRNGFLYELVYRNLERGIREGLYRSDLNLGIVARLRLHNVLLPLNGEIYPAQQFSFSEVEHELITYYLNGIVTPQGARMIEQYTGKAKQKEPVLK